MPRPNIEWNRLRRVGITLGVTLGLGLGAVSGATYFLAEQKKTHRQTSNKLRQSQEQFHSMQRELDQFSLYLPRFKALEERLVVARTARWKDRLKAMDPLLRQSGVEYECAVTPPKEVNPFNAPAGGIKLNMVAMKCKLELLHEGEFFDFMEALNGVGGLILTKSCTFTSKGEIKPSAVGSNITTECDLEWFTINSLDDSWGKG